MYEYKFVRVSAKNKKGLVDITHCEAEIATQAKQGWRLVQILVENPPIIPDEYMIVLEKTL